MRREENCKGGGDRKKKIMGKTEKRGEESGEDRWVHKCSRRGEERREE